MVEALGITRMKEQLSLLLDETTTKKSKTKINYEERIRKPEEFSKACKVCEQVKPLTAFPFARRRIDRRETHCKDCANEQRKRSVKYYPILVDKHGEECMICGTTPEQTGKRLAVDHHHKSGVTRGLLCDNCNHGIGKFIEDEEIMNKAIDYLGKYK